MRRARTHTLSAACLILLTTLFLVVPFLAEAQATPGAPAAAAGSGGSTWDSINNVIKLVIWTITAQFFGFLVWTGGGLLDYTVSTFVVEFGVGFQNWGLGFAVNNLWTVVRDLFNLTFIFALVYIGFRMILDSDDSGAKKAIVNLVIAALLVNFSLFFTKAIIDFTNITATQVANVIYSGQNPATTGSISGTFMNSMGLSTVLGSGITRANAASASWSYIIGTIILCLIAAFAFIAGAILLGIRFISLNFFMVISPIMFIGRVFPFLQSWQSNFWNSFLKNAFFAPAFLLMLYFSIYILQNLGGLIRRDNPGLEATFNATVTSPNVNAIAVFLLAGGFLIGSVLLAQKMSVVGGDVTVKMGNKLRGSVQRGLVNGALAAPRWGARTTLGRAGAALDKKLEARGWRSDGGIRSFAKNAAEAKFLGGSKSFKTVKDAKDAATRAKVRADAVTSVSSAVSTFATAKNPTQDQRIEMEREVAGASNEQIMKVLGGLKAGSKEYNTFVGALSNSQYDSLMKAKDEDLNDKDKQALSKARTSAIQESLQDRARVAAGNKERDRALANGSTPEEAAALGNAARDGLSAIGAQDAGIKLASISQLKALGEAELTKEREGGGGSLAAQLTFSQIDDIKKSDLTETEKERIIQTRDNALVSGFNAAVALGGVATFVDRFKDEDFAKLPKTILVRSEMRDFLTPGRLNEIKKALSEDERRPIRNYIRGNNQHVAHGWIATPQGQSF